MGASRLAGRGQRQSPQSVQGSGGRRVGVALPLDGRSSPGVGAGSQPCSGSLEVTAALSCHGRIWNHCEGQGTSRFPLGSPAEPGGTGAGKGVAGEQVELTSARAPRSLQWPPPALGALGNLHAFLV